MNRLFLMSLRWYLNFSVGVDCCCVWYRSYCNSMMCCSVCSIAMTPTWTTTWRSWRTLEFLVTNVNSMQACLLLTWTSFDDGTSLQAWSIGLSWTSSEFLMISYAVALQSVRACALNSLDASPPLCSLWIVLACFDKWEVQRPGSAVCCMNTYSPRIPVSKHAGNIRCA